MIAAQGPAPRPVGASGFDYDQVDDLALRERLKADAADIRARALDTVRNLVQIGKRLRGVHAELGPRQFREWIAGEDFPFSPSTAWQLCRVADTFGELDDCLDGFQIKALKRLAANNVPPAAVTESIDRARSGELVTEKKAREILDRHNVKPLRSDAGLPRGAPVRWPSGKAAGMDPRRVQVGELLPAFRTLVDSRAWHAVAGLIVDALACNHAVNGGSRSIDALLIRMLPEDVLETCLAKFRPEAPEALLPWLMQGLTTGGLARSPAA